MNIKIEPPKKITAKNVCYWYEKEGRLIGDMKSKALKFLKNNLIQQMPYGWIVLPIEGYNKTAHKIINMECSCQWFKKGNGECSHIKAVKLFKFMNDWNG